VDIACTTVDSKNAVHGVLHAGASGEEAAALGAREAVSLFRRLGAAVNEGSGPCTLVEALPQSGRTHQLRVHLAWLGHSIVDDCMYNAKAAARLTQGIHPGGLRPAGGGPTRPCELKGLDLTGGACEGEEDCEEEGGAAAPCKPGAPPATDEEVRVLCPNCIHGPAASFNAMQLCATEGIRLVSVEYTGPGWAVKGPLPEWAVVTQVQAAL
jgi:hypothetical protein